MVKGILKGADGKMILVLGLSQTNVTKLQSGHPILFSFEDLKPGGIAMPANSEVMILAGDTEVEIMKELGLLPGATAGGLHATRH